MDKDSVLQLLQLIVDQTEGDMELDDARQMIMSVVSLMQSSSPRRASSAALVNPGLQDEYEDDGALDGVAFAEIERLKEMEDEANALAAGFEPGGAMD